MLRRAFVTGLIVAALPVAACIVTGSSRKRGEVCYETGTYGVRCCKLEVGPTARPWIRAFGGSHQVLRTEWSGQRAKTAVRCARPRPLGFVQRV